MSDAPGSHPSIPPPLDELLAQRRWVRALARRLVADDARADDVEQAAWVEAIERPPRRGGSPRGWLTVVVRNAARKLGRAEGRRARHESAAPPARPRGLDAPADELVAAAELQQRVARAVLYLDEPYRSAILLRFWDDLPPAEIASRLGIPEDTVRTRVRRGLEKLRGRLDRDHGGVRAAWAVPLAAWQVSGAPGGCAGVGGADVARGEGADACAGRDAAAGGGRGSGSFASKGAVQGARAAAAVAVARGAQGSAAAAVAAGGVAMGLAKKLTVAAVALLLLAGGAALVASRFGGAPDRAAESAHAGSGARPPAARTARTPSPSTSAGDALDAIPEPVDLSRCDRDLDLHGVVVRTDGSPVAGAAVAAVAYPWRRSSVLHGYDDRIEGPRSRTARDGTFALRLPRGADVSLRVSAPGLVDAEREHCQAGERVRIVLAPGVRLRIECFDAPPGDTWTAAGDDEAPRPANERPVGAPRAGVRWKVFNSPVGDILVTSREVTTDASGAAVVDDLPPSQQMFVGLLSDGIGDPSWIPVQLPAEGEVTQRIVLPAGRTIRGRVTDATTGAPIAGARIGVGWRLVHAVLSASDGTFALPGWTGAGDGGVEVRADGYAPASASVGDREVVDFALSPGFAAAGRVVGAGGTPVEGARVSLIAATRNDQGQRTSHGHALSAPDGTFRIAGLARDMTHDLVVLAEGHGRLLRAVTSPAQGDVAMGDVVLAAPQTIEGRVIDARGDPVPRAQVVLRGPDAGALVPGTSSYTGTELRRTDDLGRFRFPDLAPGGYEVKAQVPGVPPVAAQVDLPPGTAVVSREIVAGAGRSLGVRVVDEEGRPVERVNVSIALRGTSDPGAQTRERTGPDGCARFVGLTRSVQAMAWGRGDAYLPSGWLDVPDGAPETTIVLRRGRRLRVRLRDPDGRGVAQASVLVAREREFEWQATTDGSGEFTTLVPASGVSIRFEGVVGGRESGWTASCDELPEVDEVTLVCAPTPTDRTLRVKVETPDGEPIHRARVRLGQRWLVHCPDETTDGDGTASFDGLAARPLRVQVTNVGDWVAPACVEVVPAGQEIVVRARRGVAVRGTLLRPGGQPVRGRVGVRVVSAATGDLEEFTSRGTADDGRFTLLVPEDASGPFEMWAHAEVDRLDLYGRADDVRPGDDVRITLRPAPPR